MSIFLHHRHYVALLVDITLPVASVSSHLTWNKQIIGSSFSDERPAPQVTGYTICDRVHHLICLVQSA